MKFVAIKILSFLNSALTYLYVKAELCQSSADGHLGALLTCNALNVVCGKILCFKISVLQKNVHASAMAVAPFSMVLLTKC